MTKIKAKPGSLKNRKRNSRSLRALTDNFAKHRTYTYVEMLLVELEDPSRLAGGKVNVVVVEEPCRGYGVEIVNEILLAMMGKRNINNAQKAGCGNEMAQTNTHEQLLAAEDLSRCSQIVLSRQRLAREGGAVWGYDPP
jgi:hypothetical protein